MPIIIANLLAGRDEKTKAALIAALTAAAVQVLQAPEESVRVIIQEIAHENYGIAGLPVREYRRRKG